MKLVNNAKNNFIYARGGVFHHLAIGQVLEVPDDIAKVWLKNKGVEVVEEPKKVIKKK